MDIYGFKFNKAQHILANATSSAISNAIASPTSIVTLTANVPVYFEYGSSASLSSNSTSHYLAADTPVDIKIHPAFSPASSNVYVSVLSLVGPAMLHISERE